MNATHDNLIETHGLTKSFAGRPAVTDLNLSVPSGCAFGFLGHNGAGKTTAIRMLLGLTRPDAGTMSLLGRPLPGERQAALARVGAIVEEPHFHGHLSGRENLFVVAAARGCEAIDRIESALARVGLTDRATDSVRTYSQGMRQRLGVARCLLADPQLLILDEPMNGLDPGGILEFRAMIGELVAEGRTVFLSSHLLDEVEKTCQGAAVIDRGRLIAQGPLEELIHRGGRQVDIGCDDLHAAVDALDGESTVAAITIRPDRLRLTLAPQNAPVPAYAATVNGGNGGDGGASDRAASIINARLVRAGISVFRIEPVHESLEQRFLEMTSRVGGDQ
jgi:ABC-2 type transport system ATP-binding protein